VRGRRLAAVGSSVALGLVAVAAALAATHPENYRYARTKSDDAAAAKIVLRKADLPPSSTVQGGPSRPDETPETARDVCNGKLQVEHDLVVTGDAHSSFRDAQSVLEIESQARLFKTAAMAAKDFARDLGTATKTCLAQTLAKDSPPEQLVSFRALGSVNGFTSKSWLVEFSVPSSPNAPHVALALTDVVRGRTKAQLATGLAELQADAPDVALRIQATALAAMVARMR